MDIKFNQSSIKISTRLFVVLKQAVKRHEVNDEVSQITFNYRDTDYSSEAGGYHPVEIAMQKDTESGRWSLLYITDFSYCGYPFSELCTDLDFDFGEEQFNSLYSHPLPINHRDVKEFFNVWQGNFLSYLESGAFDEIEVSAY